MKKIAIQLTDDLLLREGVNAITDFYKTIAIKQIEIGEIKCFITGIHSSFLNAAIEYSQLEKIDLNILQAIRNFFNLKHNISWALFSINASTKKIKFLLKNKFNILEKSPGMYFDLSLPFPLPNHFKIEEVRAGDDLSNWIKPIQESFASTDNCKAFQELHAKLMQADVTKLKHFVLYHQDQPTAAGTLFLTKNAVMLHNLATRPQFRHQGMGTALTLYLMNLAKDRGYRHCFLDSSEDGYHLYQRLGFKVYCITHILSEKIM